MPRTLEIGKTYKSRDGKATIVPMFVQTNGLVMCKRTNGNDGVDSLLLCANGCFYYDRTCESDAVFEPETVDVWVTKHREYAPAVWFTLAEAQAYGAPAGTYDYIARPATLVFKDEK